MIPYGNFHKDSKLFEAGEKFTALFGGKFWGLVPYGWLTYTAKNDHDSYTSPYEETAETLLQTLRESVESDHNLIMERWSPLKSEPGCVY